MKRRLLLIVAVALAGLCVSPLTTGAQPSPFDTKLPGAPAPVPPPDRPAQPAPAAHAPVPVTTNLLANRQLPAGILVFDAEAKEFNAKSGDKEAKFVFNLTNISSGEITVTHVQTTCGCTVAHLTYPWKLAAGASGEIPVTMNLIGKSGSILKGVTVHTDQGLKSLSVKTIIEDPAPGKMTELERNRNRLRAHGDSQAVFREDCARCHVQPVIGKMGKELYTTACGICHEAEHRATMVPDLQNLPNDTNTEYWKQIVAQGKPNTLMPGFSQSRGGPLSEMQIANLVEYLVATMPALGTNSRPATVHASH
jgi:cytochrome c553